MTPNKPKELHFNDAIKNGTAVRSLDDWDSQVKDYYLALNNRSVQIFEQFIELYFQLMVSMAEELPGFVPKFSRGSEISHVLVAAAIGAHRNLRVARKLLLEGYFLEMHTILRMVEQWLECAVVVEGDPEAASRISEKGISSRDWRNASNASVELQNLLKSMQKTFSKLSQRAHITKTAFNLIRKREAKEDFFVSGAVSEEMFNKDAHALTTMAMNALKILLRHFQKVPPDWLNKFRDASNALSIDTGAANKTE